MSTADARLFASAIATAPVELLASLQALIEEAGLVSVLLGRISDRFDKQESGTAFASKLAHRTEQLAGQSRPQLMLSLYAAINRAAGVAPRCYAAPEDFADNAEDILTAIYRLVRKHDPAADVTTLNVLVQHQAGLLFEQMQCRFSELSGEDQAQFIEQLKEYVLRLPEEQRRFLLQHLRVDELSDEVLRKTMVSGALGSAFVATVGIGGFSVYMGASSLLAGMAGLVGLTLPFGMYTALASVMSLLASPLFLLAVLGGGGYLLVSGKNRDMRERLLPVVVTHLVVSSLCLDEKPDDQSEAAISIWQRDWQQVLVCRDKVHQHEQALADYEQELAATRVALKKARHAARQLLSERSRLEVQVVQAVRTNAGPLSGGGFGNTGIQFGRKLLDIEQRVDGLKQQPRSPGLFDRIKEGLTAFGDTATCKARQFKLSQECAVALCKNWELKHDWPVDSEMLKVAQELAGLNDKQVPLAATILELQLLEREQLQERIRMTALVADLHLKTADAEKAQQGMEKIV